MTDPHDDRLQAAAGQLIGTLQRVQRRIVFAESCTAGLIAATLGRTPGVSNWLCGSAVVYRNATKSEWLGVSPADLGDPQVTAVSAQVAEAMATGVLEKTPEADLAASVTGYLGPDSPENQDGLVYIAIAARNGQGTPCVQRVQAHHLTDTSDRSARQAIAARLVLESAVDVLTGDQFDV